MSVFRYAVALNRPAANDRIVHALRSQKVAGSREGLHEDDDGANGLCRAHPTNRAVYGLPPKRTRSPALSLALHHKRDILRSRSYCRSSCRTGQQRT